MYVILYMAAEALACSVPSTGRDPAVPLRIDMVVGVVY